MQSSHAEFGQAAYQQQYSYASTLSNVPSNSGHDMNKQVAAGQQGMFSNSGGMPTTAQHHQSGMGGPIPSPQSASLVQQGQQLTRQNMQMQVGPYYQARATVPRNIPTMARNPLTTVVNQTGQQPSSQYSHTVQMLPSAPFHPIPQIMMNQFPTVYQQRAYNPQQYPMLPQQQVYLNNWSANYNNPPQQSSNGYYPQHGISTFNAIQPQMPQQQPQPPAQQQTPRKSKAIDIINPNTGKSVFLDDSNSGPHLGKEMESDPSFAVEFAKQVALTLTNNRNEPLSKQQSVEDTSIVDPQNVVLCPVEADTSGLDETETRKLDETEDPGDLADTESLAEMEYIESRSIPQSEEPTVILNKKNIDPNSINKNIYENFDVAPQNADSVPVAELRDPKMYDMVVPEEPSRPDSDELVKTENVQKPDSSSIAEKPVGFCEIQEVNNVQPPMESPISKTFHEIVQPPSAPTNLVKEENKVPVEPSEASVLAISSSKTADKLTEGKKNKTKKKKDINKRGESKEGGEMDAFLDTKQEDAPVSPIPPPVPTPVERLPSPVPILDSEILSTIPLPGEILYDNSPVNEISPSEPTSETSSISPSAECEDKENAVEETPNKIVLKYSYKEDQWSPLNPEGKKQYDRNFLLQLQGQPMSLCKPNNLPNLDVIKDKAHIQRLTEVTRVPPPMIPQIRTYNDPFMPNFARGGAPRLPHPAVNRRSQQGRGGEKPRKVIAFTSSLTQNIKLHESENAWKPLNKLAASSEINQDDLEREKLKRNVQGVLNKLTPQKFETLLTQLKNLNIDTEDKLNLVIDLIFEKAIDEPNFSVPYANLCKHLALIKVPVGDKPGQVTKPGQQVNFRKLLLTKCQKEFEQDRINDIKHEERMKAMEDAEPEKRKEMKLEFDDEEKKMRYRQLGNIRFIGELFKLGMLIEPIMHECIKKLLSQGDEESLECLCRLLKTIGKELDEGKSSKTSREQTPMDLYFGQMLKFVDKRMTSSRVRFMLQDVIDLKKNNWVPRRDENMPKTIDQIHKEAEREAREQQQVLQNMSNYPKRPPDDRDRRKNTTRQINQSEDGWTSSSKSNKGSYSQLDPTKLKLTKPDEVDSIRLGPGGRGLQSWGRGSSGGTKTPADDVKAAPTANRYSALSEQSLTSSNYEGRRGSQRSAASSRESSRGRSNQLPTAIRKTPSTSKEREELLETVKGLTRASETKVQDTKKNLDVHVNGKAPDSDELCLRGPEYSDDEMERKTKPLIDEFLHNNDYEEAIKCVTELASPSTVHMFINAAINQVLERSSQARYSLGKLLYSLLKKKILSIEQYKKGCGSVLEIIDDYALDIPLIWDYMGEIIEPMIEDGEFPLTFLKEVLQPCIPSETAGLLVSAILHTAAKRKGSIKLGELWRESGMQWTDFLGGDINVNDFIQKHKLEFTICPTKVKPIVQMSIEELKKNLLSLLENDVKSEEVFDWIDANVSENTEPNFVRALVSVVHENVISGSGEGCKLDGEKLKKRTRLLTRYIGHTENLELQALYAIQSLMNQLGQPSGLLHQIFNILYDDDVITEETFKAWESSDDPNEAEGKGVAVHSVKSFFTWLREADSGDEEADE